MHLIAGGLPELLLLAAGMALLVGSLRKDGVNPTPIAAETAIELPRWPVWAAALATLATLGWIESHLDAGRGRFGWLHQDRLAAFFQLIALGGTLGAIALVDAGRRPKHPVRVLGLLVVSTAGVCLLAAAATPRGLILATVLFAVPGLLLLRERTPEGAVPPATVAWFAVAVLGGTGAPLIRFAPGLEAFAWRAPLALTAVAIMTVAHTIALNRRRMSLLLGWLVVGQVGFLLLAIAWSPAHAGVHPAVSLQAATLLLVGLAALALGALTELELEDDPGLDGLAGLAHRNPWLALALVFVFATLAGLPPTLGFVAKLELFLVGLSAGQPWLTAVAALNLAWVAWLLLRVIRTVCWDRLEEPEASEPLTATPGLTALCVALPALALALGLHPDLIGFARRLTEGGP